jgi:hypothetical protein
MPSTPDSEDLPFAPGASPFRLKGIVYRGHAEYAAEHIPGGETAVNAAFKDARLRTFMQQRFLASSWYDALPIVPVWHASARVLQQPAVDFLRVRTRHQALQDIHGVYRLALKVASPEQVAMRLPRIVLQYFDFGKAQSRVVRPGVVHFENSGVPALMAPWFAVVAETYVGVALELSGAKTFAIRRRPTQPAGEMHGIAMATLAVEVDLTPDRT